MAEQMTQIAQELQRIIGARDTIGSKAVDMELLYTDKDGKVNMTVDNDTPIEYLADAIANIDVYESPMPDQQAPGDGVTVSGEFVQVSPGYHKHLQNASVKVGNVPAPTISVDANTGVITASVTPTEGYVREAEKTATQDISHENLKAENIKANTKVFGVTGTFTSDANLPTETGDNPDVVLSSHITKDFTAYVRGQKVLGTLDNVEGTERFNNFDPLTANEWTLEGPVRIGGSLKVGLSNDLLNALKTI